MKNATRVLDLIGTVWNTLVLLLAIVALIFGIIAKNHAAELVQDQKFVELTVDQVTRWGAALKILSIIFIILTIASIIVISINAVKLNDSKRFILFHVIITLSGVFTLNPFFLLGGMFGIVIEDRKEDLD